MYTCLFKRLKAFEKRVTRLAPQRSEFACKLDFCNTSERSQQRKTRIKRDVLALNDLMRLQIALTQLMCDYHIGVFGFSTDYSTDVLSLINVIPEKTSPDNCAGLDKELK